jgi:hypothetical protein
MGLCGKDRRTIVISGLQLEALEGLEDREVELVEKHMGQEAVLVVDLVMVMAGRGEEAVADSQARMGERLVIAEVVQGQIEVDSHQFFAAEQQALSLTEHGLFPREI